MATHDYVIANGTGAAVRSDLNDALAAIVSNNSGSSEPATTYAYQWWADTTANVLKIRNSANNAWITLRELDGTMLIEDGSNSAPGLAFADDTNTGIFSPGADQIGFATGGAERFVIETGEVVVNDPSNDVDFRVESNSKTHMLFVDAGNDRVGIGAESPSELLHLTATSPAILIESTDTSSGESKVQLGKTGNTNVGEIKYSHSDNSLSFRVNDGERARIDSSGRLLVGTTTSRIVEDHAGNGPTGRIQIEATNSDAIASIISAGTSDANRCGTLSLGRHRNSTVGGTPTVVQDGDSLGAICFAGGDGTDMRSKGAKIVAEVDGTPGSNDMPGKLVFSTTADGGVNPTERMTIKATGQVGIGVTAPSAALEINDPNSGDTYLRLSGLSSNTADANYAGIEFYNTDSSGIGPGVQAWIEARATGSTGAGGDLVFGTYPGVSSPEGARGVERMRIAGDSYIRLSSNAGGIQFNGDTAAANALHDYEEGTWTPGVSTGTISASGAQYIKIGNLVKVCAVLAAFSNRTSTSDVVVTGLPFATSTAQAAGSMFGRNLDRTAYVSYVRNNDQKMEFYSIGSGTWTPLQHQHLNSTSTTIYFQASYIIT